METMRARNACTKDDRYNRPWRTHEAAAWTGMSERQLLEFARMGVIPAKKIGGTWYFAPKRLAEFFDVEL